MEVGDLERLLTVCDESIMGLRDRAILMFLADTGCRAGGLVGLRDSELHLAARRALLTEKGDRDRHVYFLAQTAAAIQAWQRARPATAKATFCALNSRYYGRALTIEGLYLILKRLAARAGIVGRWNPHSVRHMFALQNIEAGNDLLTVSQLLGHTDLRTTEHYLKFTDGQRAARHDRYSPLNQLEIAQ